MPKMDEGTLKAVVSGEVRRAIGYMGGTISIERMKALNYYLGRPFGNEVAGRSSVVSTDVCDVIESILPSLLKIFTSGDKVVKFEPQGPEDQKVADQATDYCNWIFNRDNPGFTILYDWMKDALIQKLGTVKIWWEETEDETAEEYEGLTDDELNKLLSDDEVAPIEHTSRPDESSFFLPLPFDPGASSPPVAPEAELLRSPEGAPPPVGATPPVMAPAAGMMGGNGWAPAMLHDIKVKRTKVIGRVKIVAIPPEEFLVSPGTRDTEGATLMAHRKRTTRSALIEQGYDRKVVDAIPAYDFNTDTTEEVARWWEQDGYGIDSGDGLDPAADWVWVTECYINVDYDGDGKTELRKITLGSAGDGGEILENEPCEARPFYFLCPIRTPHVLIGRSEADLVMDTQLVKSTVQRGLLDNMYLINSPQTVIVDGEVNLDDLLTRRPGGVIRTKRLDALTQMTTPSVMGPALQTLEYLDSIRESRTGVTRYNQGLDADSLNKTASGINQIMSAGQERILLIARIFAETGIKDLFRGMLRLVAKHQQKERMIRLRNEWVAMDPRQWNTSMDVATNVGLGTGNKDQMLGHLMTLMQLQEKVAMAGNPGGMVDPKKLYNAAEKMVENMGLKSIDPYFNDPDKVREQAQIAGPQGAPPPPPPPPSPEQIKAQTAQMQAGVEAQSIQLKAQKDAAQHEADMEEIEMKRQKNAMQFQADMQALTAQLGAPVLTNGMGAPA